MTTFDIAAELGLPELWQVGLDGRGIRIAIVDTGVDDSNPLLRGKVVERMDLVGGGRSLDHGTHVAGIAAARQGFIDGYHLSGMAPGAELIDIKVVGGFGKASLADVVRGVEEAIGLGAKVINLSLGALIECCHSALRDVIAAAAARGAIVVAAAGNYGPEPNTVACPGMVPDAVAVGSVCMRVARGEAAWFSSRGPSYCTWGVKPDAVAFGGCGDLVGERQPIEAVVSTGFGSSAVAHRGTSQASPVVAGIAAVALQAAGDIGLEGFSAALSRGCEDLGEPGPDNTFGQGLPVPARVMAVAGEAPPRRATNRYLWRGVIALMLIAIAAALKR